MDNDRPSLDLKYFDDVCPDKNGKFKHNLMSWGSFDMKAFSSSRGGSIHKI
jgi:hypothetical protein